MIMMTMMMMIMTTVMSAPNDELKCIFLELSVTIYQNPLIIIKTNIPILSMSNKTTNRSKLKVVSLSSCSSTPMQTSFALHV